MANIPTNCNLPTETVRDHSDRLVRIETKLDQVLDNMELLFDKASRNSDRITNNETRLTVIETEKKTAIALIVAIISGIGAIVSFAFSAMQFFHKQL